MDGIANIAKQQQSQFGSQESNAKISQQQVQQVQQVHKVDVVKQMQEENTNNTQKIDSKEKVQDLVDELNKALSPMNTSLKFGVDMQDIFYVSVIDAETSKMIRRFPAEDAATLLPKMREVSGILFDSKG